MLYALRPMELIYLKRILKLLKKFMRSKVIHFVLRLLRSAFTENDVFGMNGSFTVDREPVYSIHFTGSYCLK